MEIKHKTTIETYTSKVTLFATTKETELFKIPKADKNRGVTSMFFRAKNIADYPITLNFMIVTNIRDDREANWDFKPEPVGGYNAKIFPYLDPVLSETQKSSVRAKIVVYEDGVVSFAPYVDFKGFPMFYAVAVPTIVNEVPTEITDDIEIYYDKNQVQ